MTHPTITQANAQIRYQALLQEAEAQRQAQKVKGHWPNVLQQSGHLLAALGQLLKADPQPQPEASAHGMR